MAARIKSNVTNHERSGLSSLLYTEPGFGSPKEKNPQTDNETLEYLSGYLRQKIGPEDGDTCMNILENFMLNTNVDVVAYSLGKLYFLFNDEKIQKSIVEELKNLKLEEDELIHRYVEDSIESIAEEVNSIDIMKLECNIFENISHKFELYLNSAVNRIPHQIDDKFRSRIQKSRIALQLDNMIYTLEELIKQLETGVELHYDYGISGPNHLKLTEMPADETNFNQLVDIYALTFREQGHIEHLISLSNDESPAVRIMGVDGLLYVLKVLTKFHEQIPGEGTLKEIINSIKSMPKFAGSFKTGIDSKKTSK